MHTQTEKAEKGMGAGEGEPKSERMRDYERKS